MFIFQTGSPFEAQAKQVEPPPFPSDPAHRCAIEKEMLEAGLGSGVKFLAALNLLLHLCGTEPDAKPELFNIRFTEFTDERGPGSCSAMACMPNMRC
jgi:hypothetical protein